jgi:hypothetical protein
VRHLFSCFILALLSVGLPGCSAAPESDTVPQDFSLRLARGPCEGPCPIYSISVDSRGNAQWQGERFVRVIGTATKRVTEVALQRIVRRARELRILSLVPGKHISCIDAPMAEIELTQEGRSIFVAYCDGDVTPEGRRVIEFAKLVDEALADETWVGGVEYRKMQ